MNMNTNMGKKNTTSCTYTNAAHNRLSPNLIVRAPVYGVVVTGSLGSLSQVFERALAKTVVQLQLAV